MTVPNGWTELPSGQIVWRFWCESHYRDLLFEPSESPAFETKSVPARHAEPHEGWITGIWTLDWTNAAECPGLFDQAKELFGDLENMPPEWYDTNHCAERWRILSQV